MWVCVCVYIYSILTKTREVKLKCIKRHKLIKIKTYNINKGTEPTKKQKQSTEK
jgi:hypothetical protein